MRSLAYVVSSYDGWLLIVKGWSVTLSLAALGLGFQQGHYALFALAALTGAAFWFLDGLMKGYQFRYYVRMREIEYTAYLINSVALGGEYGGRKLSAPRIDMTWGFKGYSTEPKPDPDSRAEDRNPDWRADEPLRRSSRQIREDLRRRFWLLNVMLPHILVLFSERGCSSLRCLKLLGSSNCICEGITINASHWPEVA